MKVVLASSNAGKLAELTVLLAPLDIELELQRALGIDDAEETATTFVENALIKARHASLRSGQPAIADDSGLVVPALNGAPGVFSARYAGVPSDAGANNRKLITALANVSDRRASFYCALVFMRHGDDPAPLIATAEWRGRIVDSAAGSGGFGYDPHFYVEQAACTAAEMSPAVKNGISHRGRAAAALMTALRTTLEWPTGSP